MLAYRAAFDFRGSDFPFQGVIGLCVPIPYALWWIIGLYEFVRIHGLESATEPSEHYGQNGRNLPL
jgi:hypothetical protein